MRKAPTNKDLAEFYNKSINTISTYKNSKDTRLRRLYEAMRKYYIEGNTCK